MVATGASVRKRWQGEVVDGRFHLSQHLGGSDHSSVFLTEYDQHKAAIKLIPAGAINAELRLRRWERVAKLSHPSLIRIFHAGRCQLGNTALLYVVTEYAEEDLSQILPERRLSTSEARAMLPPVLDALKFIHGQGLVHDHIKPSNIMAVRDQLKISTDSLRAVSESRSGQRSLGAYDAPEVARGAISPAADIWSLGMTLVEALTQHLPAWDTTGPGEPILPQTIPAPFLNIAHNCLRRDPNLRWTTTDIAARLQRSSPESLKPATAGAPRASGGRRRRNRVVLAFAAVALLAILAGPRLLNRHPEVQVTSAPQPATSKQQSRRIALPAPALQPAPDTKPENANRQTSRLALPPPRPGSQRKPETFAGLTAKKSSVAAAKGDVLHQALPNVSQSARNTIQGKVRVQVRVNVDSSGNVVQATFDSPGPSKYFARLAMQAARDSKFTPPQAEGHNLASEWLLRFAFGRTSTEVFPTQVSP